MYEEKKLMATPSKKSRASESEMSMLEYPQVTFIEMWRDNYEHERLLLIAGMLVMGELKSRNHK
jgi:hypothetical protein